MDSTIKKEFYDHLTICQSTLQLLDEYISLAADTCIKSLKSGGKIILLGNGGSAADAQHIAAELIGRYKLERESLAAIALTTDSSVLTCIGNDYGFDKLFNRQIHALAKKQDVVIGISTSGASINVLNAINKANELGCKTIALTGNSGGEMKNICDINIIVPSQNTPRIQEMHILIGHTICQLIDNSFATD